MPTNDFPRKGDTLKKQPNIKAAKVKPVAGRESKVLNEKDSVVVSCRYTPDPPLRGFLQLCADRRFHRSIQELFQADAKLKSPEDYWIHADAGGTPKMAHLTIAPNYCYHTMRVRLMGWAAHGNICGGFKPGTSDKVIKRELLDTMEKKVKEYPKAKHFIYFATTKKKGDAEEAVVYCLTYDKGAD